MNSCDTREFIDNDLTELVLMCNRNHVRPVMTSNGKWNQYENDVCVENLYFFLYQNENAQNELEKHEAVCEKWEKNSRHELIHFAFYNYEMIIS